MTLIQCIENNLYKSYGMEIVNNILEEVKQKFIYDLVVKKKFICNIFSEKALGKKPKSEISKRKILLSTKIFVSRGKT